MKAKLKSLMHKWMIDCEQATFLADKSDYVPVPWRQRWQLKWHLAFCPHCRLYYKQSKWIHRQFREIIRTRELTYHLSEQARRQIIKSLNDYKQNNEF